MFGVGVREPRSYLCIAFALAISVFWISACGGGGSASTPPPPSSNPTPAVASLSQTSVTAGSAAMTLTITGSGFVQGSVVQWNQSNRTTTFVSSTELQVALTAADLATAGTAQLMVVNPGPGGGISGPITFTINNPTPVVASLSQTNVTAGSAAMTLTITGSGFVQGSVVQWNQSNRTTTFVSSTQLQIALAAADLATAGTAQIVVVNSGPGGGSSSPITFTINNPTPQISAISPSTVTTVDGGSVITITGTGFVATSSATWNLAARATSYVSSTQLQLKLQSGDLTTVGSAQISVVNSGPGGGTATPVLITIVYPVPSISSLNPTAIVAGSQAFTLTVNGAGFAPSSVVQYNGVTRPTAYINSSTLTIGVSATDIATPTTAQITVSTGSPGGGVSAPAILTIDKYPLPTITSVSPNSITVNSPDTLVTIQGTGFISFTTVQVNGATLTPNGWNTNYIFVTIPAANFASVGSLTVTVSNPGSLVSNAVTINVTPNPVPTLTGISPASAAIESPSFTLTLSGSNFVPTSVVQWNGSARPTTFSSANQLTAAIPASDIESLGNSNVTVVNPAPGGGTSATSVFTTYLSLLTNDMIYDSSRNLLWASVPSGAGPRLGNSIVPINPNTGVLGTPVWVGSEPNKLAISGDGTTLWVGLQGSPSVRKIDLTAGVATAVNLYFPGGWGYNIYATSLAVLPGSPSSVAVSAGLVSIFDNVTPRSKTGTGATYLSFGSSSATLYGYSGGLSIFSVDSTGIASTTNPPNSGTGSSDLRYDNGRLYLTSGGVLDGISGNLVGTFAASGPVAPDSTVGRAFVLNAVPNFGTPNQITAFDVNTFVPIGSFSIGGVQTGFYNPSSLVRWGQDGLAFRTGNQLYVLRNPLVRDLSATPADVAVSSSGPNTSATGTNTSITINVKNNGPNTASNVTVTDTFSSNVIFVSTSATQGSCGGSPIVRCDLGNLGSGATATATLVVVPTSSGVLTSTANVSATQLDPNLSNNTASSLITVTGSVYNPVPGLSSLAPQSALAGAATVTLTVNGSNFSSASTVNWNGSSLPTTLISATQLSATVDASLLSSAGSASVAVRTSSPGGGLSGSLPFTIFQAVALDTNDVIFDPFTRKIYASVPSTASQVVGNSIVSIDPVTAALGSPIFMGSEPTRLALSDDGHYLYTTLAGSNAVRRLDLTTGTPGTQFTTVSTLFGAFNPSDLAVMPGNANVLATVGYSDGIQVWDVTSTGATARPITKSLANDVYEGSVVAWADSVNLYSNDEGLSPSSFHRFTVTATSFGETDSTYLDAVGGKITYSGGLVYSDGGGVVDASPTPPLTPRLAGRFMNPGGGPSAADATINRVFFLTQNSYGVNSRTISAFDAARFTLADSTQLDGLTGDAFDLIRWGADGLAFRTAKDFWGNGTGRVVLFHGPAVLPLSPTPNPKPSISAISPSSVMAGTGNTWVTITGSNFVPGATAQWNGSLRTTIFVNSTQLRVAIPAADLTTSQTATLQVSNPLPGGGVSAQLNFAIT
jgi:trimeric autotransporter adhesin